MNNDTVAQSARTFLVLLGLSKKTKELVEETDNSSLTFKLRAQVMSDDKAVLYRTLVAALKGDLVVFAKVRLADFLVVKGEGDNLKHGFRIDRKFVDFLLCDPISLQPCAVVELVDSPSSAVGDRFIDRALGKVGILSHKIQSGSHCSVRELRELIIGKSKVATGQIDGLENAPDEQFGTIHSEEEQAPSRESEAVTHCV